MNNQTHLAVFFNTYPPWDNVTFNWFFRYQEAVKTSLLRVCNDPKYNHDTKLHEWAKSKSDSCNQKNKKFQKHFTKKIPYISYVDRLEIYHNQNGRCFYSNLPVVCEHANEAFRPSIERKNVLLPYLKDNIVICWK